MTSNQTAFLSHVSKFNLANPATNMKYLHSLKVEQLAVRIGKRLKINEDDLKLAREIALLHDIGRFEQIKQFGQGTDSFRHDNTLDHAQTGADLLFSQNKIKLFDITPNHYPIIRTAIINHNRLAIEPGLEPRTKFHCQLIRDADKIDILRVIANRKPYPQFNLELIPDTALDEFNQRQLITSKVPASDLLRYLGYLYDFNFPESRQTLLASGYLEQIYAHVTDQAQFQPFYDSIYIFFKKL